MYVETDTIADDEREYEIKSSYTPKTNEYCYWLRAATEDRLETTCGLPITVDELFDKLEGYRTICCPRCKKPIKFMKD